MHLCVRVRVCVCVCVRVCVCPQAAAQQRRGRAGRVRPGICFRLFSRAQWSHFSPHTQPEMLRSPLESVVLLIKGMAAGHAARKGSAGGAAGAGGPASASSHGAGVASASGGASGGASASGHGASASSSGAGVASTSSSGAGGKPVSAVLSQCLSPPDPAAVRGAVELLQHLGAIDEREGLLPLGHHLKQMPVDPR